VEALRTQHPCVVSAAGYCYGNLAPTSLPSSTKSTQPHGIVSVNSTGKIAMVAGQW
jgi:hypothetical protein